MNGVRLAYISFDFYSTRFFTLVYNRVFPRGEGGEGRTGWCFVYKVNKGVYTWKGF